MNYKLEQVSSKDREKILSDASSEKQLQANLTYKDYLGEVGMTWAVDRERNAYMFLAPVIVKAETLHKYYCLFFKGMWYSLYLESMFEDRVILVNQAAIAEPLLSELRTEICAAFAVFGCYGTGPLNENGFAEFAVSPTFDQGAK